MKPYGLENAEWKLNDFDYDRYGYGGPTIELVYINTKKKKVKIKKLKASFHSKFMEKLANRYGLALSFNGEDFSLIDLFTDKELKDKSSDSFEQSEIDRLQKELSKALDDNATLEQKVQENIATIKYLSDQQNLAERSAKDFAADLDGAENTLLGIYQNLKLYFKDGDESQGPTSETTED